MAASSALVIPSSAAMESLGPSLSPESDSLSPANCMPGARGKCGFAATYWPPGFPAMKMGTAIAVGKPKGPTEGSTSQLLNATAI